MWKGKLFPFGKARSQGAAAERMADPADDPEFLKAAEKAMRRAGLKRETVAVLKELYRRRRSSGKS